MILTHFVHLHQIVPIQIVCHSFGPVDNTGVCLYKEPVVAIHIFLVALFIRYDTGGAKSHDETSVWNYTEVSVR